MIFIQSRMIIFLKNIIMHSTNNTTNSNNNNNPLNSEEYDHHNDDFNNFEHCPLINRIKKEYI